MFELRKNYNFFNEICDLALKIVKILKRFLSLNPDTFELKAGQLCLTMELSN